MNVHAEEYSVVTSDNVEFFDFSNRTHIALSRCLPEVPSSKLKKCKKTLESLCFRQLLTRVNLRILLVQVGQTLTQLIFENVLFDEYKRNRNRLSEEEERSIDLPNLKELYFSSSFSLTKNDYFLLDFITRKVSTRKLDYFEFIGNARAFRDMTENFENFVMEEYGQIDGKNNNTVANFLIRNRQSLRFIVIGGTGFQMFNDRRDEGIEDEIRKMELTGLDVAMDDDGIQILLESQQKLSSLVVTAVTFGIPSNSSQLLSNIFRCWENNYYTLVEVYFRPKVVTDASRETLISQNIFDTFTIDCSLFAHCPSLRYLTLGLNLVTNEFGIHHGFPDEQGTICGSNLRNIHRLPKQLSHVNLDAEDFNFVELELLANQFFKFTQLQEFSFRANSLLSFLVRIQWVWVLFQHPKMRKVVFEGGVLDDMDGTHQFINGRPHRDISMTQSGSHVAFRRDILRANVHD